MTKPSRKSEKRLAKGMFMRGKVYYVRFRQDGRDTARSLGSDYATAMLRYAEYRARLLLLWISLATARQSVTAN